MDIHELTALLEKTLEKLNRGSIGTIKIELDFSPDVISKWAHEFEVKEFSIVHDHLGEVKWKLKIL